MNKFLKKFSYYQGDKEDLEKNLILIERYINDCEHNKMTREELVNKILLIANKFHLDEFQTLFKYTQSIDIQLLLGLTWHYLDSLAVKSKIVFGNEYSDSYGAL